MRSTIIALIVTTFASAGWAAEPGESKRFENIGLGSGAAIGAAAGGPVGLLLGAAAGIWLGDRFDAERSARDTFEERWTETREQVAGLNGLIESSERQIAALETRNRQDARAIENAIREALDVHILFKTDETEVADNTQDRLVRLASLLAHMEGMSIRVGGYADSRGDAEHNAQLSAQRAANVRTTLIQAGIPDSRISVDAFGEQHSVADEKDLDALAFDRRVQLTLIPTGSPERVARQ
jgi:outer membrane protein OmpA-like peptidoglycan-associated protein